MRIDVALKLRPFSHQPGIRMLVPYTTWEVQIFPTKLFFLNLAKGERKEVSLDVEGPVIGFTSMLNLEKGRIEVFGRGKKGYFRFFIEAGSYPFLLKKEVAAVKTRLSLGVHKKQEMEMMKKRCELAELLPFWVRIAQLTPYHSVPSSYIPPEEFTHFFQAGFVGFFSPRLEDENHLGILPEKKVQGCPLGLLHYGAEKILSCFFHEKNDEWSILPHLPKELHAGRLIRFETDKGDQIDLEWAKKKGKKIIIRPQVTREVTFHFKNGVKAFRVRKNVRQKGEMVSARDPILLTAGQTLFLDRFTY